MLFTCLLLLCGYATGTSDRKGLAQKPQMGWNTYNAYKLNINESIIRQTADLLVSTGMRDVGYSYLVIDDAWNENRDANGRQQANRTTFPGGIPTLASYAHSRNLKLGIYSDAGIFGCGFRPGSYGYEELDAATFAEWGIDYLKYDNCGGFQANTLSPQDRFWRMKYALQSTGREIFFSLCQWGHQFPWLWADQLSESYRMSGDIYASFAKDKAGVCKTAYCLNIGYAGVSVLTMINKMKEISYFQKPGSWADMDLLEIGNGVMTEFEEQTQFSFWAALKSPLIASTPLASISKSSLDILLNKEIIAISQDEGGVAVNYVAKLSLEGNIQVWGGPLKSGKSRFVILAFNESNSPNNITIPLREVPGFEKRWSKVKDIWGKRDLRIEGDSIQVHNIQQHQTKVLVFS